MIAGRFVYTKKINSILISVLVFFAFGSPLFSFEWPLSEVDIASTFGEYRHDTFFKAIELEGKGRTVTPIEKGKVVFTGSGKPRYNGGLPNGLGNTVVIEHERGIRSLYGYLSDVSLDALRGKSVQIDSVLSKTGNSGSASGHMLYLQILDSEFEQIVNPLVSLPAPKDNRAPEIEEIVLLPTESGGGNTPYGEEFERGAETSYGLGLEGRDEISAGSYVCSVKAYDTSEEKEIFRRINPFSFGVYVNGEEKIRKNFEAIEVENNRHILVNGGLMHADRLYGDAWRYRLGRLRLSPGDARIEIVVSDYVGNEVNKMYRLDVR